MLPTILRRGIEPRETARRRWDPDWLPEFGEWEPLIGAYPVDIREDEKHVYVEAEMPGFSKEDVELTLENGVLRLRAERKDEGESSGQGEQHLNERRYRRIERSFTLPTAVDEQNVDAQLRDGVLHITLNKHEKARAKRIDVK